MFSKEIVICKKKLDEILNDIKKRIIIIKKYHKNITPHNTSCLAVIGLDSLTTQREIIELQYTNMQKYKLLLINKMYCENYKIHKFFTKEINTTNAINNTPTNILFPPYKDLEQYKEYDFNHIIDMNKNTHIFIEIYKQQLLSATIQLEQLTTLSNKGYSIANYIVSLNHNIVKITEKINYYEKFIEMLEKTHYENFSYLINNVSLLLNEINKNIMFNDVDFNNNDSISIITNITFTTNNDEFTINDVDNDDSIGVMTYIENENKDDFSINIVDECLNQIIDDIDCK